MTRGLERWLISDPREVKYKRAPAKLAAVLGYEPETGLLRWKHRPECPRQWNTRYAGKPAGELREDGVLIVQIDGVRYQGHRLAWALATGADPCSEVDHVDGDPNNNRLGNLREATHAQNRRNSRARRVGPKGTRPHRRRFTARITCAGTEQHLGSFRTEEEAGAAYAKAAQEMFGEFACHTR